MKIKSLLSFFFIVIICLPGTSCDDGIDNNTIDCIKQETLIKIEHSFDPDDRKTVNLSIDYTGGKTIKSVSWHFGDGISEADSDISTTHTYTDTGLYKVTADVDIVEGISACMLTPSHGIKIK